MAKTLRVRQRAGWTTKPVENRPENRLTSEEIDDTLLQIEDDYTAGMDTLSANITQVDSDLTDVKNMFTAQQSEVYFGTGAGGLTPGKIIEEVYFAKNDAEVNFFKAGTESFSNVLGMWTRFSHGSLSEQPYSDAELRSWTLNPNTNQIESTKNTVGLCGFLSLDRYDTYVNEVVLSSTNSDDDTIGLVIAEAYESDDKLHLLHADVVINSSGSPVFRVYSGSTVTGTTLQTISLTGSYAGWAGVTVKMKVVRTGDNIVVSVSQPNGSTYDQSITVDLTSLLELAKYRGKTRYGYVASSQIGATWQSIVAPGFDRPIIDITRRVYWAKVSGVWVSTPITNYADYLDPSRLYYDSKRNRIFRTDESSCPHELEALSQDTGWIPCTLLNGSASYLTAGTAPHPAMYRKQGNIVHIKGIIVPPTTSGSVAFYLPAEFQPQHGRVFGITASEFQATRMHIGASTDGVWIVWSGTRPTWVSIECIYAMD